MARASLRLRAPKLTCGLRRSPHEGIANMWRSVDVYFGTGRRICLVGALALDVTRDRFTGRIRAYFVR